MNNGTKKRQLQGLVFISYVDNLFFNGHPPAGGRLLDLHLCLCCQSWLFHMLFLFSCHMDSGVATFVRTLS